MSESEFEIRKRGLFLNWVAVGIVATVLAGGGGVWATMQGELREGIQLQKTILQRLNELSTKYEDQRVLDATLQAKISSFEDRINKLETSVQRYSH
jgi:uncharacterized protein HemX